VSINAASDYDLAVIGSGPGGCAAAIRAARSGAKVLLLERGRFPRHKVCGEFVSAESLDLLEGLLTPPDRSLIANAPRIPRGRIFADGAEIGTDIKPPAVSVARFELDAALWRSCLASGVDSRDECAVQAVEGTGPFTVKTQTKNFSAKAVINATGRWSNLTSPKVRSRQTASRWIGIKAHYSELSPPASVDLYFFNGGYCGVQPIAEHAVNACAMVKATAATTIEQVLQLHPVLRNRSRNWARLIEPLTTSPLIFHDPEPFHAGMLQVGDAATFVDPFVGDGISLALRSGALAAECLNAFFRDKCTFARAAEQYSSQYRSRLSHVFRASSMMRRAFSWPAVARRPVFALLQKTPRLTRHLVKMTR
jgi:flavin-dependent dehydrogenase